MKRIFQITKAIKTLLLTGLFGMLVMISNYDAYSQAGTLDATFGTAGKVITNLGQSTDRGRTVVVQPDGKILVGLTSYDGINDEFAIVRYNQNGTLDNTFNGNGQVRVGIETSHDVLVAIALQADGKIVAVGYGSSGSGYNFYLARFNSNGTLDTSFDTDGKVISNIGDLDEATSIAIQADGKIVVGGFSYNSGATISQFALARYNSNGSLDTSFDTDGIVLTSVGGTRSKAYSIAIQADGKILLAGDAFDGTNYRLALARYTTTGSLDTSFDTDGMVIGSINEYGYSVIVQSDNKILVGGSVSSQFGLLRYNSDGSLDTSFDTDGKITTSIGVGSTIRGVTIQSDNKIIAVGSTYDGGQWDYALARYNSNGTLDTGFGSSGKTITSFGGNDMAYAVAIDAVGQILLTGQYATSLYYYLATARYNSCVNPTNPTVPTLSSNVSTLCSGSSAHLTIASGSLNDAANWQWYSGSCGGTSVGNGTTIFVSPTTTTTYFARGEGGCISGGSCGSITVTVNTNPNVAITTQPVNKTICVGNSTSFAVVATGTSLTYQWRVNTTSGIGAFANLANDATYGGATSGTLTIANAGSGLNDYRYQCVINDGSCTTTSQVVTLTVNLLPVINTQPTPSMVCEGASPTFSVSATNPGTYQWQEDKGSGFSNLANDAVYSGVTGSVLTISGVINASSGYKYRCVVGSCSPAIISNDALLTVNPRPVITTQPTAVSLCNSGNTTFSIVATGATSYQWQKNNSNLSNVGIFSGVTTATLTLTGATTADNSTSYRCIVTGSNACTNTSASATLFVYVTPVVSTHPANSTKCVGSNTTFTVAVTSPPAGLTYQWQEKVGTGSFANLANGGIYSTVTAATLTLTGVTAGMNGNKYRCVVGTCLTPVNSFDADLIVDSPPIITLQPLASAICTGMSTTFSTNTTGLGVTFQWQKSDTPNSSTYVNINNGGIHSGATTETLTLTNVPIGENGFLYRCVVTAGGVCAAVNTSNVLLTVRTPPTFTTQPVDKAACEGLSVIFSPSVNFNGAPSAYQWQLNNGIGGFIDLQPDAIRYPSGVTGSSLSVATTALLNGHKYRLRVGACTPDVYSSEVTLTVNTPPTITASPTNKTICPGESATFTVTAAGTGLTYQWQLDTGNTSFSNISGGTTSTFTIAIVPGSFNNYKYQCLVTGTCSQATSQPATLTVNETKINTHPANTTACVGDSKILFAVASGASLTYQWKEDKGQGFVNIVDGGIYSGATTANLGLSGITVAMKGYSYQCIASGTCGTTPSTSTSTIATLTVNETKIIVQPANATSCVGGSTAFNVNASGQSLTIQWQEDKGSGFVNITNGGIYSNTTGTGGLTLTGITAAMSGYKYQFIATSTCGTVTSASALLTLATPAKPTITVNATTNPEAPVLTASAGGTYEWFKDGTLAGGAQTLVATSPGVYTVKTSTNGCSSVLSDPVAIIITGDVDASAMSSLHVYPNPGSDHVTLSLGGFEKDKPVSISIVDMQGRVMEKTAGLGQREISIDIRNYAGGKYIAWLQQRTTKVARQFIKTDK